MPQCAAALAALVPSVVVPISKAAAAVTVHGLQATAQASGYDAAKIAAMVQCLD